MPFQTLQSSPRGPLSGGDGPGAAGGFLAQQTSPVAPSLQEGRTYSRTSPSPWATQDPGRPHWTHRPLRQHLGTGPAPATWDVKVSEPRSSESGAGVVGPGKENPASPDPRAASSAPDLRPRRLSAAGPGSQQPESGPQQPGLHPHLATGAGGTSSADCATGASL